MEATPPRATPERRAPSQPSGWTVFAAVVLLIVGALDALWVSRPS
jgi:hypothetical protein